MPGYQSAAFRRAFTLIELLIVVAIIAILAAIAVPNFLEAQTRAKISRAKADMRSMATAAETYCIDYNTYMISDADNPYYNSTTYPNSGKYRKDSWGTSSPKDYEKIYGQYSQKYDGLFRLTSPVAYMTSLPMVNPFGEYAAYNAGDIWEGYTYRGPSVMGRVNSPPYAPAWGKKYCLYAFDSTGPSKRLRDSGGNILVYDPTNGTVSTGGIWYVKGPTSYHSFN